MVLTNVRPIVEELARDHGLVVWDVEFRREAGNETLRVSVDRTGGADAEELRKLSETLSYELDVTDAVPGEERYILEVTTPGAERKLRSPQEFQICRGRHARLTFKDGREPLEGEIGDVTDDAVELQSPRGGEWVRFDDISQARLKIPGVS
jgi:ribosome maturation factor RimP